jgi:tetratricopeptide (TPR) repeat protein
VIYPPDREAEVLSILGPQADQNYNYQAALQKSVEETASLTGRDQFFALFNRGTDLVDLHDYQGAAVAYDAAFANYPSIPEKERPWRILWYQTGPYFAYYFTGRYQDVIDLATTTLDAMSEPVLEESYYWRGMAKLALGDTEGAIADFRKSVEAHPGFQPALEQLQLLGAEP